MERKKVDKLMNAIIGASALIIIVGAVFKLQHWPYGSTIFFVGFMSQLIFSTLEIRRLKKIRLELEKKNSKIE